MLFKFKFVADYNARELYAFITNNNHSCPTIHIRQRHSVQQTEKKNESRANNIEQKF